MLTTNLIISPSVHLKLRIKYCLLPQDVIEVGAISKTKSLTICRWGEKVRSEPKMYEKLSLPECLDYEKIRSDIYSDNNKESECFST